MEDPAEQQKKEAEEISKVKMEMMETINNHGNIVLLAVNQDSDCIAFQCLLTSVQSSAKLVCVMDKAKQDITGKILKKVLEELADGNAGVQSDSGKTDHADQRSADNQGAGVCEGEQPAA